MHHIASTIYYTYIKNHGLCAGTHEDYENYFPSEMSHCATNLSKADI